jgi:uncharacterized protein (DUF58 family)
VKRSFSATPTAVLIAIVAIVATFTAFVTGALLAHLVSALLVAFLAVSLVLAIRSTAGITIERRVPISAYDGDDVEVEFVVTNAGRTSRSLVEAVNLFYTSVGNTGRATALANDVAPHASVTLTSLVRELRRGEYVFPPPAVMSGDPFGLFSSARVMSEAHAQTVRLTVFPPTFPIEQFEVSTDLSWATSGLEQTSQAGAAGEFLGTREYRPGDSVRAIHWPLSARMGELIVKEFERSSSTEVTIFVDLDAKAAWGKGREHTLEYAIKIAASVAQFALRRGNAVGLVAHTSQLVSVPPGKGDHHQHLLMHHLAAFEATGATRFNHVIEQAAARVKEGSSVVIVFPSQHLQLEQFAPALERLWARRIRVTAIILDVESFVRPTGAAKNEDTSAATYLISRGASVYTVKAGVDLARQLSSPVR